MRKSRHVIIPLVFAFFFVSSFSGVHAESTEEKKHITTEAFVIDTYSEDPNEFHIYEKTGYKRVESITEITNSVNFISTKISAVEDYYDVNDNYQYSLILKQEFSNDYRTGLAEQKTGELRFNKNELTTISVNRTRDKSQNGPIEINSTEALAIEKNIEEKSKLLVDVKYEQVQGFTRQQFLDLKMKIDKLKNEMKIQALDRAGAYDNYYNYEYTNGNFVAQALSAQSQKYIKYVGTTIGDSKNASAFNTFRSYIDDYETNVVDYMESNTFYEVLGWASALSSFVLLVVGWGTGPAGWITIVLNYGGALSLFAGLTSTAYGTYSRLQYSKNAATSLENARNQMYYNNWGNISMSVVNGV